MRRRYSSHPPATEFAHLIDLPDHHAGLELGAQLFADTTTEYFGIFGVMRDYGMYDRAEAPQYFRRSRDHRRSKLSGMKWRKRSVRLVQGP
jgi:hypothetical protein